MKYLVDADILSESTKPTPHAAVTEWLQTHEADLLVNPIIMGEVHFGILRLPDGRKRKNLLRWFEDGITRLNVLPLDAGTASFWARLLADLRERGRAMPVKDSLNAASALQHGLTVVTRNTRDYAHAGVPLINPFD